MSSGSIGTLRLYGKDAASFARSFFFPSETELAAHEAGRTRRNESVSVRRTDSGFESDVADLNLSFLEEEPPL